MLRQGISGGAFYVILEGEAVVVIDGQERSRLGRGEYFGEISALTGGVPVADIRRRRSSAASRSRGPQLEPFLLERPTVMLRMLQAEARRLRDSNRWQ